MFDSGLVTFSEDGSIRISPLLANAEKLGIGGSMRVELTKNHEVYMHFHRNNVFRPG